MNDKLIAIQNYKCPETIRELRRYLGMVHFYHSMIPNCSKITSPLSSLLKTKSKKLLWTDEANKAFVKIKEMMTSDLVVQSPDYSKPFVLTTDASGHAIGAVLHQHMNSHIYNIGYFWRTLYKYEQKYSAFDR